MQSADASQFLSPHIRAEYKILHSSGLPTTDLAQYIFQAGRFDIPAKLIYAKAYLKGNCSEWAAQVYREHIRAFNNFDEADGSGKRGEDAFIDAFEKVLTAPTPSGPSQLNTVPIDQHGLPIDGSHRLVRAYLKSEPVYLISCEAKSFDRFDLDFFKKRCIADAVADEIAACFALDNPAAQCVVLFPAAGLNCAQADALMEQFFEVFYRKEVGWRARAPKNIIAALYAGEEWLGAQRDGFPGAGNKYEPCFTGGGALLFYVIQPRLAGHTVVEGKEVIRKMLGRGNHSLHTSINDEEKLRMVRLFLNLNSLDWANRASSAGINSVMNMIERARPAPVNSLDLCYSGSCSYGAYGVRMPRDIDYIVSTSSGPNAAGTEARHNEYVDDWLRTRGMSATGVLDSPLHHFYFFGHKVMSIQLYNWIKRRRLERKDVADAGRYLIFVIQASIENRFFWLSRASWHWARVASAGKSLLRAARRVATISRRILLIARRGV